MIIERVTIWNECDTRNDKQLKFNRFQIVFKLNKKGHFF